MPRCKNCPPPPHKGCYYTGKENTPLGRGWSARYEESGKRMKGTDGKYYQSNGDRWVKVVSKGKRNTNPRGALYNGIRQKFEQGDYNNNDPLYGDLVQEFTPERQRVAFALERYFINHPEDYNPEYVDYIMTEHPNVAMNIISSARGLRSIGPVISMVRWLDQNDQDDGIADPVVFNQKLHYANIQMSRGVVAA